jgi:hypothetical protein
MAYLYRPVMSDGQISDYLFCCNECYSEWTKEELVGVTSCPFCLAPIFWVELEYVDDMAK